MRRVLIIYVLVSMLSLIQAERKAEVQKPEVTKLEVLDLSEAEVKSDTEQADVQRKRDSGYSYGRPNRVSSSSPRLQANQLRGQVTSKIPGRLNRPFMKYGPPNHSVSTTQGHTLVQQNRNKLQLHVGRQQSTGFADAGLAQQEAPSPIRNVDFAQADPIASQNNEPFGMHTANYLPPQNQKPPAYSAIDGFAPQTYSAPPDSQSQNLLAQSQHHQISDAALFLSENAQAIQQLYGAPASSQDFVPGYNQFRDNGDQIQNGRFQDFESTSQNPEQFRTALPPYASGTLGPRETLEQIQSLEKDRLIVQLQQALAQAQTTSSAEARYAQNQELLSAISQRVKSHVSTTPQTVDFAAGNAAFSQSPFLPGTTVAPLGFPLNYGASTTAQTPTTTTTAAGVPATPSQTPLASAGDDTTRVTSSLPALNQPGRPAGIPAVYGGFVPAFVTATNFVPSYSTGVFTSRPVRPVQAAGTSPTHFGLPIPTQSPDKPATTTTVTFVSPTSRPGILLTPSLALPVQPIRPVAATPLHPVATTPIAAPLHPALPVNPAPQVHPAQTTIPAVTSGNVHPTYGLQTATLLNSVLYKPIKAVYPLYYYPDVAYQLQKPVSPSYPWNYAPSYAQTKPAQIWK